MQEIERSLPSLPVLVVPGVPLHLQLARRVDAEVASCPRRGPLPFPAPSICGHLLAARLVPGGDWATPELVAHRSTASKLAVLLKSWSRRK